MKNKKVMTLVCLSVILLASVLVCMSIEHDAKYSHIYSDLANSIQKDFICAVKNQKCDNELIKVYVDDYVTPVLHSMDIDTNNWDINDVQVSNITGYRGDTKIIMTNTDCTIKLIYDGEYKGNVFILNDKSEYILKSIKGIYLLDNNKFIDFKKLSNCKSV